MATLTGKAVSELPAATAVNDADLFAISQSGSSKKLTGSTLLGNLVKKTGDTMSGNLNLKTLSAEVGETITTQVAAPVMALQDKNATSIAYLRGLFRTTGRVGVQLVALRGTYSNGLSLELDEDGTRTVTISSQAPWRSALGLGTNGDLPITVSQGGSGQTSVSATTTVSDVIASTGSGITVVGVNYCQWGKVAMFDVTVKLTNAVTTITDTTVATLISSKRPKYYASAVTRATGANNSFISTDGTIHVVGTLSANTNIHVLSTYILA